MLRNHNAAHGHVAKKQHMHRKLALAPTAPNG
jgi:hypothetical protein